MCRAGRRVRRRQPGRYRAHPPPHLRHPQPQGRNSRTQLPGRARRLRHRTIIQDIVESDKSVLLLGPPRRRQDYMLREVARLSEKKRVIIVDTSNEIAGDGDIPHPAIGHSRRMQVETPTMQHEVMIEAVKTTAGDHYH